MKSSFVLGAVTLVTLVCFAAGQAEEEATPETRSSWPIDFDGTDLAIDLAELGIIDPGNDTNQRVFKGGYDSHYDSGSGDKSGSGSGSGERKYSCESKLAKLQYKVKKCEQAKDKISTELQSVLKRISKLEKQLEFCRSRKTCEQLSNEFLASIGDVINQAASCVKRAFSPRKTDSTDSYGSDSRGF